MSGELLREIRSADKPSRSLRVTPSTASHSGMLKLVPIYPREIVKRALELGASAVILVHNHPSGDLTPSKADAIFSQEVQRALSVMNMALHDSLIIGKNGFASLRSLKQL